ncbi:ribonuclease E inhibitor RraB [Streptomyces sp. NPDC046976]|uniref:ribonuclease E inhibitor RraB n=1 Tax=Streptomyces sp. NPDC046976 TaxID=3155258 RepID=UPI0033D9F96C
MSSRAIPYTHWAYFPDRASAERCALDLGDYVTRIREPDEYPKWLLLAGRDVGVGGMVQRHREVKAIVTRHGGDYDGGEAGLLEGDPTLPGREES